MAEQTGHAVADALRVLKALAEHHVAAALAMDRPRCGEMRQPCAESLGGGEPLGMQFGISARQPATIARLRRRFVGQR